MSGVLAAPLLKWVGGKRRLLGAIRARMPSTWRRYYEPFVGGGAVFFDLAPVAAVIGDSNVDLVELYCAVRADAAGVHRAACCLLDEQRARGAAAYYAERDRWNRRAVTDAVGRGGQMLYLARAAFNGLWRVNAAGDLNAPIGDRLPAIPSIAAIEAAAGVLARAAIRAGDFAATCSDVGPGDVVYVDPPYDPISTTSSFTAYAAGGFGRAEQQRLRAEADRWASRGAAVVVSSSDTPFIRELWGDWQIDVAAQVHRNVSASAEGRRAVNELVIRSPGASARGRIASPDREGDHATPVPEERASMSNQIIEDVVERGLRRTLPVKLTEAEFTEIAKRRAVVEQERDDMRADLDKEKKRRAGLIEEREDEIAKMGRELRTGEQERSVPCSKVFRRDLAGDCWVITLRDDTGAEVARDPAPASVVNKHLQTNIPGTTEPPASKRSVIDQARDAQAAAAGGGEGSVGRTAADAAEADVPDPDGDEPDDGDESDELEPDAPDAERDAAVCFLCDEQIVEGDAEVEYAERRVHKECAEAEVGDGDPASSESPAESRADAAPAASSPEPAKPKRERKAAAPSKAEGEIDLGDRVTWTSQAGGSATTKTGIVAAVIPAGKTPRAIDKAYDWSSARQHVSYVVDVDSKFYWPVVSQLRRTGGKAR